MWMAAWAGSGLEKDWLAKLSVRDYVPHFHHVLRVCLYHGGRSTHSSTLISCSKDLPFFFFFVWWQAHPLLRASLESPVFFVLPYFLALFRHYLHLLLLPGYLRLSQCRHPPPNPKSPKFVGSVSARISEVHLWHNEGKLVMKVPLYLPLYTYTHTPTHRFVPQPQH